MRTLKIKRESIKQLFVFGFLYFMLATGLTLPDKFNTGFLIPFITVVGAVVSLILARTKIRNSYTPVIITFLFCVSVIYALNLNLNDHLKHQIVVNGYMVPLLFSLFFANEYQKLGEEKFLRYYIRAALMVLILTVIYKLQLGFSNRTVRYFLNGPIVFGWMSAITVLILIRYNQIRSDRINYFFIAVFIFGVLWSLSKGPLLALIICLTVFYPYRALKILVGVCVFVSVSYYFKFYNFDATNYRTIQFFVSLLSENGWQVIQSQERFKMILHSLDLLEGNYLTGIGVSNFEFGKFYYPHNLILNLLIDGGAILFFAVVFITCYIYSFTSSLGRCLLLFGIIVLLLSGNTTYLRFIFLLPLVFLNHDSWKLIYKGKGKETCNLL